MNKNILTTERLDKGIITLNKTIKNLEEDIDISLKTKNKDMFMELTNKLNEKIIAVNYIKALRKIVKGMININNKLKGVN